MTSAWPSVTSVKSNVSSANNRCDMAGALLQICNSFEAPCWTKIWGNPSATRRNKYGESGLPRRRPREGVKDCKGSLLKRTE
jgi:hypothetical protein